MDTATTAAADAPGQELTAPPARVQMLQAIIPTTIMEVEKLATWVAQANWAPKSYLTAGKPDVAKISLGIMQGLEVGLKPVQALQSIAVINGVPALYGDGALAVVYAAGIVEDFGEVPIYGDWKTEKNVIVGYTATLKRKGRPTPIVRTFTLQDAENAKLLGKQGPWQEYRSRMVQMRARSWTLRDGAADALKGLSIIEEAIDVPFTVVRTEAQPKSAQGKLDAFAAGPVSKTFETTDAQFTEVVSTECPEEVQTAFGEGRYAPYVNWIAHVAGQLEGEEKQTFVDGEMESLLKVRATSDRNKAVIDSLAETKGFELKFPEEA